MFQKALIGFYAKSYTTPLKALLVGMVNMKLNQREVSSRVYCKQVGTSHSALYLVNKICLPTDRDYILNYLKELHLAKKKYDALFIVRFFHACIKLVCFVF